MSRHEFFLYAMIFLLLITAHVTRYTRQVNDQKTITALEELDENRAALKESYYELIKNSHKYGWAQGAVFGASDAYDTIPYQEQFVIDSLIFETILE